MITSGRARRALAILGTGVLGLAVSLGAAGPAVADEAVPAGCTVNDVAGGAPTEGDDVISCLRGIPEGAALRGLGGHDKITVVPELGEDYFGVAGILNGGPGDDTLTITGEHAGGSTDGRAGVTGTVNGGPGTDTIVVTGGSGAGAPLRAPGGPAVGFAGTVNGGPGDDTITATGGPRSFDAGPDGVLGTVNGGDGNDSITATGGAGSKGSGGDGLDEGTINGGKGDDKITAAGGKTERGRTGAGVSEGKINGGPGADTITATGRIGFYDSTVQAGPGNDVIKGSVGTDTTINGGDGKDTCPPKDKGEVINCESTKS